MKILGYSVSNGLVVNSDEETSKGLSALEFLLQPRLGTLRILYNLDSDVSNLLSILEVDNSLQEELKLSTKLTLSPYHLKYTVGKLFSIKRRGAFVFFANARQYCPDLEEALNGNAIVLAKTAKYTGDMVYLALLELGISPTSLVSPARAYEKCQVEWLRDQRGKALEAGDLVKEGIIETIGNNTFGEAWSG